MSLRNKKAFTLIELLVVIAIIALLLSILMPALTKVKKQAQAAICLSNVKQWGTIFSMYAQENKENFPQNYPGDGLNTKESYWCYATMNYYDDASLRFCPSARRNKWAVAEVEKGNSPLLIDETYGQTFQNWGPFAPKDTVTGANWWDEYPEGSYGMNEWCSSPKGSTGADNWPGISNDDPKWWRNFSKVSKPGDVPVFLDAFCVDGYPRSNDTPPTIPDQHTGWNSGSIKMFTMDRHAGGINALFVDISARKVFIKELWKLKWQREFDTNGPWTKSGGATRTSWEAIAPWMAKYKDF
jgi:prepilin-type N-terminal cleavage/methylation domain-containing protein/prepilin-type processing-associated H-X9-DG protein